MNLTVNAAESAFWLTVAESPYVLPLDYPEGATSASVTVTDAFGYERTYPNQTGATCSLDFPAPSDPLSERVYTVTVAYSNGETASVRLGRVCGVAAGDTATGARCVRDVAGRKWGKLYSNAVIPVPAGAGSLKVNGETVETGLGGLRGWYQLGGVDIGETCTVQLADGEVVTLTGAGVGALLILR